MPRPLPLPLVALAKIPELRYFVKAEDPTVLPTSPFSTVPFDGWSNDLVDLESCPAQVLSGSRNDPLVMRPLTVASSLDRSK